MNEIQRTVCAKLLIGMKTYPIYMGVNTIGRNRNAVVTIKNLNVSQHQALIAVVDDTQHFISDLMSSNGTSMNNTKLAPFNLYHLEDNAEIVFGDVKATYLVVTSHTRNSSEMDLTCTVSQTQSQNFYASTTQLINKRQNSYNQTSLSQETECYSNELETQEADYPLLPNLKFPEKITNGTPVQDHIFLKPKDLDNSQQDSTNKENATIDCRPTSVELVLSVPLDVETELIEQSERSGEQTDTESTEIISSEGVLESSSPMQAIKDVVPACDQQDGNPSISNTSMGKIAVDIPSGIPIQSIAPEDPKDNSSMVENLQVTNKESESSHVEAKKDVIDTSTAPQSVFIMSRKSLAFGSTLCNESVDDISHTSTSSGIGEQLINESADNTNSDSNDSINFLKVNEELSIRSFNAFKKKKISKFKVLSDSDTDSDDFIPIQKTKTTKLDSEPDSQIEATQEIGYRRKPVKKLDSDESQLENSGSETDCEEELRKVKNGECETSIGNEEKLFDDSECIPATQDIFIDTTRQSKMKPTFEHLSVDNEASEGKELLISDGNVVKTTNHSSEESFKLGISEYILDEADQEVNKIMNISNLESQEVNNLAVNTPEEAMKEVNKADKGQEKRTNDTHMLLHNNQSGLNKVTGFLIPSQNFNDELYTIGTQRLTQNECFPGLPPMPSAVDSQNDDIYLMSTQPLKATEDLSQSQPVKKYGFKKKTVHQNESLNTLLGAKKGVCDDMTTQHIDGNDDGEAMSEKLDVQKENDIFIQPTQCISTGSENPYRPVKDDCFLMPTQPPSAHRSGTNMNDHKATDEYLDDLQSNKASSDDQKKSSPSVNQNLNTSTEILFEDLEASQSHVDDHFAIPAQPRVIGSTSKSFVTRSPEKSPKNTRSESYSETLSQIDTFVKQSCSKPKPAKEVTNDDVIENREETLSQIDTFIKQNFVKPKERCSEVLKNVNKTLSEIPKCGAIKIDDIEETSSTNNILDLNADVSISDSILGVPNFCSTLGGESETLSQIEEFVKSTSTDLKINADKEESTKITSRSIRIKNVSKLNSPKNTITKTTRSYKQGIPIKQVDYTLNNLSEASDDDFMDSSNRKEGKNNIKQNINQTYIQLLESKNTKIKKSDKNQIGINELKVTAGSNRRTMNIAESNCLGVSTRNTKRRIEQNSVLPNIKLQPKETCDISKPKIDRRGKRQVPSSSEISNVVNSPNLNSSGVPTINNKTTEPVTSENEQNEHSVPPKKRKYTKKTTNKEENDTAKPSIPVRQSRKKSTNDTDDQLYVPSTNRYRSRNLDLSSNCGSLERLKRKQGPKVVFTMLDNPQLESQIKQMGGSIVDTVDKCTVLITEQVKRSVKLLQAVGQGKPICSPAWVLASKKEYEFLDPWDYILVDKEAETKWKFSLKESLMRASRNKLLDNYMFQILTTTAVDVLKGAIEVCGGKCVTKYPGDKRSGPFFVIASPEQKSKYARMIKQHPDIQIIEPEAIFDGVLRQELQFDRHLLR